MKDSSTQQRLTSDQRLVGWERKLLDLTMANALVNTIYGNACIPFRENYDQDFLEDLTDRGASFPLLAADQEEKGLHSDWDKDLLKKTAKKLLRTANNNLSELGSSQLFMGVGMLRYIDNPDPLHPNVAPESHCAPVILVPVSIHYQSVVGRYAIKAQSDDILVNSTLVELLHQEHDRDLRHLVPTEGRDLDVEAVFETFGKMAASKEGWSFDGGLCLGIFAFSKFVMWNDLHTHPDRFKETPLIDSLLRQRPVSDGTAVRRRGLLCAAHDARQRSDTMPGAGGAGMASGINAKMKRPKKLNETA